MRTLSTKLKALLGPNFSLCRNHLASRAKGAKQLISLKNSAEEGV